MAVITLKDLFIVPTEHQREPADVFAPLATASDVQLLLEESAEQLDRAERLRIDATLTALLANLLSALPGDRRVELTLPSSPSLQVQLARTPLLAVLAMRTELVEVHPALRRWAEFWDPHDAAQRARILAAPDTQDPVQRHLMTLVDPHRRASTDLQRDVRGIVDPWLGRLFVARGRSADRSRAMRDLETAMSELVENVGDHAHVDRTGREARSVAQLMTTSGGGDRSHDRFRLIVMDNGIGLPKSIKARRADLNGESAVRFAFEGRLSYGDRGRGLTHVGRVISGNPGSSFTMYTELFPERNRSLRVSIGSNGRADVQEVALAVVGTLAVGKLNLPALARQDPTLFEAPDDELALLGA